MSDNETPNKAVKALNYKTQQRNKIVPGKNGLARNFLNISESIVVQKKPQKLSPKPNR